MRRFGQRRVPVEPVLVAPQSPEQENVEKTESLARTAEQAARLRTVEKAARFHERNADQLQQRINRIAKLVPGRQRINELYRIANEFDYEGDRAERRLEDGRPEDSAQVGLLQAVVLTAREYALFCRRLAYDLDVLRDEVRGDQRMPGSRNDPTLWRGDRP